MFKFKNFRFIIVALFLFSALSLYGADLEIKAEETVLAGTLLFPKAEKAVSVCIIVPGSGPVDRDGNSGFNLRADTYKLLAEGLAENGIASFRYDKRGVGKSLPAQFKEEDIRFETNVQDLKAIISHLKSLKKFKKIFLIGHSEGSLVSILCAKMEKVDGFISIAGVGKNSADLILEQIEKNPANPKALINSSKQIIEKLKSGKMEENVPLVLNSLFRKSVQPYLISWFKYEPKKEIAQLKIPVLVIQGGNDIQVGVEDSKLLSSAKEGIELKIIEKMTHTLKEINSPQEQMKTYIDPSYPISKDLVLAITEFVNKN